MLLGETLYEPGEPVAARLFPDDRHRVAALCPGVRRIGRDRGRRATKACSASRCSWAATPRRARRSCRPRATATACRAKLLKEEFDRGGLMQRLLLRYTQALLTQMCQTAACNRHHSIEQQLCRWLLLTLDRLPSNELVMTQELVASALGVRRESITRGRRQSAARRLHPLPPRPHFRARAVRAGSRRLRVLRRRQEGNGAPAVRRAVPPERAGRRGVKQSRLARFGKRGNARIGRPRPRTIGG